MKYPVPHEIFEQHSFIGGKTGAGKSFTLRGMAEVLLSEGKRVCIVDPKGDWCLRGERFTRRVRFRKYKSQKPL